MQDSASLYEMLGPSGSPQCVVCVDIPRGAYDFIPGRDTHDRLVVKYVDEGHPLHRDDR